MGADSDEGEQPGRRPSLEERIRSNMVRSALRRETLRLARAERRRQRKPRVEIPQESVVEESQNIMTDLYNITDLVALERERETKLKDTNRAERAALKLEKEIVRLNARMGHPDKPAAGATDAAAAAAAAAAATGPVTTAKSSSLHWDVEEDRKTFALLKRCTQYRTGQKRKKVEKKPTRAVRHSFASIAVAATAAAAAQAAGAAGSGAAGKRRGRKTATSVRGKEVRRRAVSTDDDDGGDSSEGDNQDTTSKSGEESSDTSSSTTNSSSSGDEARAHKRTRRKNNARGRKQSGKQERHKPQKRHSSRRGKHLRGARASRPSFSKQQEEEQQQQLISSQQHESRSIVPSKMSLRHKREAVAGEEEKEEDAGDRNEGADDHRDEEEQQRERVVQPRRSSFNEDSIRSSTVDLGACSSIDLGAGATSSIDLEHGSRKRRPSSAAAAAAASTNGSAIGGAQSKTSYRDGDGAGDMTRASQGADSGICENESCDEMGCNGDGACALRRAETRARRDVDDVCGGGGGGDGGGASAGAASASAGDGYGVAATAHAGAAEQSSPSGPHELENKGSGDQRRSTRDGSNLGVDSGGKNDRGYHGNSSARSSSATANGERDGVSSSAGGRRIRSTAGGQSAAAGGIGDGMSSLETLQKQDRGKESANNEPGQQQESALAGGRRKVVLFKSSVDKPDAVEVARKVARERKRRRARRARHRQRLEMRRSISRRGERMMAAMAPVEYAGGECTEVALDLDRGNLHVYHSAGGGRRGKRLVVPLSKVSASVAKRNPKLVVLRLSGRHLATIGQGAWREVSGQGAAYRKRVKAFPGTNSGKDTGNARPSWSALATSVLADWGEEPDVGPADFDTSFATESFSMRARHRSANRSSPPSRAPSAARRFFGHAMPAAGDILGGGDGGGALSALGKPCSSVGYETSFENTPSCDTLPCEKWSTPVTGDRTGAEGEGPAVEEAMEVYAQGRGSSINSSPRPTPPACAAPRNKEGGLEGDAVTIADDGRLRTHASSTTKSWRFITRPLEGNEKSASPIWMPSKTPGQQSGENPTGMGETGQGRELLSTTPTPVSLDEERSRVYDAEKHGGLGGGPAPATPTRTEGNNDAESEEHKKTTRFAALCSAFGKSRPPEAATIAVKTGATVRSDQNGRGTSTDDRHNPVSFERPPAASPDHLDRREFVERQVRQRNSHPSTTTATTAAAAAATPGRTPVSGTIAAPKPWTLINKIGPKTVVPSTRAPYSGNANRVSEPMDRSKAMGGLRRVQDATAAEASNEHGVPTGPGGGGSVRRRWHIVNAETNAVKACRRARAWATASASRQAVKERVKERWGGLKAARQTTSIFMHNLAAVPDDADDDLDASNSDNDGSEEERVGRSDESSSIWCESRGDSGGEYSSSYYSGPSQEGDLGDGLNNAEWQHNTGSSSSDVSSTSSRSSISSSTSSSSSSSSSSSNSSSSASSTSTSTSSRSGAGDDVKPQLHGPKRHGGLDSKTYRRTNVMPRANAIGKMFFTGSIVFTGLQHRVQEELAELFVKEIPRVDVRIVADIASTIQTVQIMPPSLVVVAWAAFGSAKVAREFLGDGAHGVRGVKSGLPVAVVGGESDGEGLRITLEAMGASAVLSWPYAPEDIKDVLNTCLHIRD